MRIANIIIDGKPAVGMAVDSLIKYIPSTPGSTAESVDSIVTNGLDRSAIECLFDGAATASMENVIFEPVVKKPGKILCIGLNYIDHSHESGFEQPDYPTVFTRVNSSLCGHGSNILKPTFSNSFDYEGELAVIIGKTGRHIKREDALSYVAGYSLFNDVSVREYQFKSPQWTIGKNFDQTGAFGPFMVTPDELPKGADGLSITTILNDEVVQSASTSDMVFKVTDLIAILSEAMTLEPGDVIVSGTPSGIGWARDPKLLMQDGDVCEVKLEAIGSLINVVKEADH